MYVHQHCRIAGSLLQFPSHFSITCNLLAKGEKNCDFYYYLPFHALTHFRFLLALLIACRWSRQMRRHPHRINPILGELSESWSRHCHRPCSPRRIEVSSVVRCGSGESGYEKLNIKLSREESATKWVVAAIAINMEYNLTTFLTINTLIKCSQKVVKRKY